MPCWFASATGRLFDTIRAVTRKDGDPPIWRSMMRMIWREFSIDDAGRAPMACEAIRFGRALAVGWSDSTGRE